MNCEGENMHNEINFRGAIIQDSTVINKIGIDSKSKNDIVKLMNQLEKQIDLLNENREFSKELYLQLKDAIDQGEQSKAKDRCELLLKLLSGTASITTILRGIEALLG